MGVYIKDMEMPKGIEMIVVFSDGTVHKCLPGMREYVEKGIAVPVPPHGDLIDRLEAIVDANERAYDFWLSDDEVNATIQFLKEQPTIIQAEEGET